MLSRPALLMLALVVSGCGPTFDSEAEERAYLHDVASPTPGQWKRRQELDRKAAETEAQRDATNRATYEATERVERDSEAKAAVAELMKQGAEHEAAGEPGVASLYFRDVVEKYPGSPEVDEARRRMEAARKVAYPGDAQP